MASITLVSAALPTLARSFADGLDATSPDAVSPRGVVSAADTAPGADDGFLVVRACCWRRVKTRSDLCAPLCLPRRGRFDDDLLWGGRAPRFPRPRCCKPRGFDAPSCALPRPIAGRRGDEKALNGLSRPLRLRSSSMASRISYAGFFDSSSDAEDGDGGLLRARRCFSGDPALADGREFQLRRREGTDAQHKKHHPAMQGVRA